MLVEAKKYSPLLANTPDAILVQLAPLSRDSQRETVLLVGYPPPVQRSVAPA